MKKQTLLRIALIGLPILAVGLATTVDSVTVFDTVTRNTVHGSYFTLLPVGGMQIFPPLAGLLCVLAAVLSILSVLRKKEKMIPTIKWISFTATLAAVLPILMRGDRLVIPNVGVPLFMGAEWIVAYMLAPKQEKTADPVKLKNR